MPEQIVRIIKQGRERFRSVRERTGNVALLTLLENPQNHVEGKRPPVDGRVIRLV
jgi:hypothetical protein